MTTLLDILKHIDVIAPRKFELPDQMRYVEVGPTTKSEQTNTTVKRVIVAPNPSARTVTKASQEKANLIISCNPLLMEPTKQITGLDLVRFRLLAKNYISLYVIGSSWISANDGLSDALSDALNLTISGKFNIVGIDSNLVPIGRICQTPSKMNHSGFANYIASKMEISNVVFTGCLDDDVDSILACAANTVTKEVILQSLHEGVKTIVTGEITPANRLLAHNKGINIFELGAFVTETPGMKRLRHQLSLEFPELKIEFADADPITHSLRPYIEDMA